MIYRVNVCVSYTLNYIILYILAVNKHFQVFNFRKIANLLYIIEGYKAPTLLIPYSPVNWHRILAFQAIFYIEQYITVINRYLKIRRLIIIIAQLRLAEGRKTLIFLIPQFLVSQHRILLLQAIFYIKQYIAVINRYLQIYRPTIATALLRLLENQKILILVRVYLKIPSLYLLVS